MEAAIQAVNLRLIVNPFDLERALTECDQLKDIFLGENLSSNRNVLLLENALLRLADHVERLRSEIPLPS